MDDGKIIELTNSMNEFAEAMEGVKVNFMLVPNASLVYEDKLPYGMKSDEDTTIKLIQDRMTDKVNYINVASTLLDHKDDGLFYKTDHHWHIPAAFEAFLIMTRYLNEEFDENLDEYYLDENNYIYEYYAEAFIGSQGRETGIAYSGNFEFVNETKNTELEYLAKKSITIP